MRPASEARATEDSSGVKADREREAVAMKHESSVVGFGGTRECHTPEEIADVLNWLPRAAMRTATVQGVKSCVVKVGLEDCSMAGPILTGEELKRAVHGRFASKRIVKGEK